MVRHGRLSKGCQTCRTRKIKCDLLLPGCTQCSKSGWTCPEYGDSVERMFQYHNSDLFKNPRKEPSVEKKASRNARITLIPGVTVLNDVMPSTIAKEITQPMDDLAIDYFLSTHAFRDDGIVRGCFEYLLVSNDLLTHKTVFASLRAAALAAYGNKFRHKDILCESRRYYGDALRLVNCALQSQRDAATNQTMIAILLLNTFEALTSEGLSSMVNSDGHMRGVMMIMNMRGKSLMDTRQGLQVFLHMCRCLITYCIMRPVRVPLDVIRLREYAAKLLDQQSPSWRLENIMIKLADFRTDIDEGISGGYRSIVDFGFRLDYNLHSLAEDMAIPCGFAESASGTRLRSSVKLFYADPWATYIRNYIRTCRLILHNEIRNIFADVLDEPQTMSSVVSDLREASQRTSDQMTSEICASAAGYSDQLHSAASSKDRSGTVSTMAGVYFLLWPLMTAGQMTTSSALREWIIRRCRLIGEATGVQRALAVADTLLVKKLLPRLLISIAVNSRDFWINAEAGIA
ncbi:hypothetical protein BJX99DRAFT_271048 [Aspergillus californicus]